MRVWLGILVLWVQACVPPGSGLGPGSGGMMGDSCCGSAGATGGDPGSGGGAGGHAGGGGDPEPGDVDPGDVDPGDVDPGDVGPGDVDPGDVDPGDVDPGDTDPAGTPCNAAGASGTCLDVADCTTIAIPGYCPGPTAIQCCVTDVVACEAQGQEGLCIDVADCPSTMVTTAGLCPGPAHIRCCHPPGTSGECDPAQHQHPNEGLAETSIDSTCPDGMLRVEGFCVDRYEASLLWLNGAGQVISTWSPFHNPGAQRVRAVSVAEAVPQAYISGVQAAAACAEAGKRLCTNTEWLRACRGPQTFTYPYGNTRVWDRCNDRRGTHPVVEYFGTSASWIWSELDNACIGQQHDTVALTGEHAQCITSEGAFDMMGNLHEWTSDPNGTFRGGFYVDTVLNGEGCGYATTAHNMQHWDYSTGFRCCADPLP